MEEDPRAGGSLAPEARAVEPVMTTQTATLSSETAAIPRWSPITPLAGEIQEADTHPVVLRRDAFYRRLLAVSDVASALIAVVLGLVVVGGNALEPTVLVLVPFVVLAGKLLGLYDRDEHLLRKSTLDEAPALFQLATLFALVIWLEDGLAVSRGAHRLAILALWALLLLTLVLMRGTMRRVVGIFAEPERCLVLGDHRAAARVRRVFRDSPMLKAKVVAELPLEVGRRQGELHPDLAPRMRLTEAVRHHDVHRVIIAPTTSSAVETLDAVRLAKALGVRVSVLPRLLEVIGSSARWDHADGLTLLGVPSFGLSSSSSFLKRALDLAASTAGLAILGPMLAAIAITIKLTSRGPVLFRQVRIGRDGDEFEMLKFRSMVEDADDRKGDLHHRNEAEGLFKIADDPRVTAIGRVIRRVSLDELPQLINVVRGDMSLVGPRPLVPEEDKLARGWQRRRHTLVPGMTGLWQVLGSARIPFDEMVMLDYAYGANWSLWLDLKILLRTALFVFARRGI